MGAVDHRLGLEERKGEAEQQGRAIARHHLDDGETVGGFIVDQHLRHDLKGFCAGTRERALVELGHQLLPVEQRILDIGLDPGNLLGRIEATAERVLHEEIIERRAVLERVDARIDDVAACQMDGACDPVEQAGMIRRVNRDERCAAFGIGLRVD